MKAAIEQYRLWSLMPRVPLGFVLAAAGRAEAIELVKNSDGGLPDFLEASKQFAAACDEHKRQHNLTRPVPSRTDGKGGWKGDELIRTAHMYCLSQHWLYGSNACADGALYLIAERRGLLMEIGDVGSPRWDAAAELFLFSFAVTAQTLKIPLDDYSELLKLRVWAILKEGDAASRFPPPIRPELSGQSVPGPSHCACGCSRALVSE